MKKIYTILILTVLFALTTGIALADELIIYPNKGQSDEQMSKDKYACYEWGKQQTGFDPLQPPKATEAPPAPEEPKGGVVKGAARGALVGVAVGAIAGDAGKGAAIGAASGGLLGGMKQQDQKASEEQKQQQWAEQQVEQYEKNRDSYNRAYSACLEGKGYTVK